MARAYSILGLRLEGSSSMKRGYYEIVDARGRWFANTSSRQEAEAVAKRIGGRWHWVSTG